VNVCVRYNSREGSDLRLVYDEGFHTDRDPREPAPAEVRGAPRRPTSAGRARRVKLTRTFAR
jgi:hypothetical protein